VIETGSKLTALDKPLQIDKSTLTPAIGTGERLCSTFKRRSANKPENKNGGIMATVLVSKKIY